MINSILIGIIGGQEIIIILIIVLVLFGGKKIPEMMRGFGKGVKEYKKALHDVDDDAKPENSSQNATEKDKNNNGPSETIVK